MPAVQVQAHADSFRRGVLRLPGPERPHAAKPAPNLAGGEACVGASAELVRNSIFEDPISRIQPEVLAVPDSLKAGGLSCTKPRSQRLIFLNCSFIVARRMDRRSESRAGWPCTGALCRGREGGDHSLPVLADPPPARTDS